MSIYATSCHKAKKTFFATISITVYFMGKNGKKMLHVLVCFFLSSSF